MWPYGTAIQALEHKFRQARREGASWADDEDGRRPAFQVGSLVAQAIADGDGWRAARALVAFRAMFGSRFFQRALRWCELEMPRIERERALRAVRLAKPTRPSSEPREAA